MTILKQLNDYRLTTAEILYHLPDYPDLLQSYIWQDLDTSPDFPVLVNFISFWQKNIEGRIHSVTVTHTELVKPHDIQCLERSFTLH